MREWSKPQKQSPAALGIIAVRFLRESLTVAMPLLLASLLGRNDDKPDHIGWLILLITFLILLLSVLRYYFFRFQVENGQLVVCSGILDKQKITIPLEKVQAVHFEQHFLNTLTRTTKVTIDSPGTTKMEVSIDALDLQDAEALRGILLQGRKDGLQAASGGPEPLLSLTGAELLKVGITANHLKAFLLLAGFVFVQMRDFGELFGVEAIGFWESMNVDFEPTWQIITASLAMVVGISMLASVVRTMLQYHDLRVFVGGSGITVSSGFLRKKQQALPKRKMQLVRWHSNLLQRWVGIRLFEMRAAGGQEAKGLHIQFPTLSSEQADRLISMYIPDRPSASALPRTIHPSYAQRKILVQHLPLTLLAGVIAYQWIGWYALILLAYLAYQSVTSFLFQRNFRYWSGVDGLECCESTWGRHVSLFKWEKLQHAVLQQNIFQEKRGLATVHFETAGGVLEIPYVSIEEARGLVDYALFRTESEPLSWN